jgi:hypothetical protein
VLPGVEGKVCFWKAIKSHTLLENNPLSSLGSSSAEISGNLPRETWVFPVFDLPIGGLDPRTVYRQYRDLFKKAS